MRLFASELRRQVIVFELGDGDGRQQNSKSRRHIMLHR